VASGGVRTPDAWILAVDPGLKALGWATCHTRRGWGPCGVLSAPDLRGMSKKVARLLQRLPRSRIRHVDVFVCEELPILSRSVAMTLQATAGIWMGALGMDGRLTTNTLMLPVTPQTWAKFSGCSKLRGVERKAAAVEFARMLNPMAIEANSDCADAIVMAAYAADNLVGDPDPG